MSESDNSSKQAYFPKNINLLVTHPYGRAGSLFIHSLFDSHPNILTLPRCGILYSLLPETITEFNLENQITIFIDRYPGIFDSSKDYFADVSGIATGKFGINGDEELYVDIFTFKEALGDMASKELVVNKKISRKDFFVLIHIAYGLSIRSFDPSQIKYIFYHPHSETEWELLSRDFPDFYFIAMTRDPRQDWASCKKIFALRMGRNASAIPPLNLVFRARFFSEKCMSLVKLIEKLKADHVRIVDLEQFHALNKSAINHLCDWLGIDFDESLMQSTFNGQRWYGNAANLLKSSTFNPTMSRDAWRAELSALEIDVLNILLPGSISYLHYDTDFREHSNSSIEMARNYLKYDSNFFLLIHCFLYVVDNPLVAFPGIEKKYSISRKAARRIHNLLEMARSAPRSIRLFRSLRGKGSTLLVDSVVENDKRLLICKLPPQLFIDYHVNGAVINPVS